MSTGTEPEITFDPKKCFGADREFTICVSVRSKRGLTGLIRWEKDVLTRSMHKFVPREYRHRVHWRDGLRGGCNVGWVGWRYDPPLPSQLEREEPHA